MANFNKVILLGNICKEPEARYTPQGTAVINITLGINRKYKSGEELKTEATFVPVVIWGKTAEVVGKYCHKGDPLMVEGRIQTRFWEKDGQKQFKTEVVAENIQLMGNKKEEKPSEESKSGSTEEQWIEENQGA